MSQLSNQNTPEDDGLSFDNLDLSASIAEQAVEEERLSSAFLALAEAEEATITPEDEDAILRMGDLAGTLYNKMLDYTHAPPRISYREARASIEKDRLFALIELRVPDLDTPLEICALPLFAVHDSKISSRPLWFNQPWNPEQFVSPAGAGLLVEARFEDPSKFSVSPVFTQTGFKVALAHADQQARAVMRKHSQSPTKPIHNIAPSSIVNELLIETMLAALPASALDTTGAQSRELQVYGLNRLQINPKGSSCVVGLSAFTAKAPSLGMFADPELKEIVGCLDVTLDQYGRLAAGVF